MKYLIVGLGNIGAEYADTRQPGDANVLCGNGMFGAKIKDEDILSLSEIRDCAFLLKPV
ncbi:hypothetical protein [Bilophila wadsworthia]|uniref:hypothetical protein n=1 Tax=Bilophila wadsworthia TaxID=35833 RepID=UPI003AB33DBB